MATRAARDRASEKKAKEPSNTPQRWWQWVLIYPALVISLLTASPQWIDMVQKRAQGINRATAAEAEKQTLLWKRNLSCSASPFSWYNNPSNIKIDATICDSGDIFVRAITPTNDQFFKWLPLEDVVQLTTPAGKGVIPSARAASRSEALAAANATSAKPLFQFAQAQANILCQKFIDDRHILRRVQTPQGCFDELIDTYNGQVVKRDPAPCTPQC
jgi:hypothetical protein